MTGPATDLDAHIQLLRWTRCSLESNHRESAASLHHCRPNATPFSTGNVVRNPRHQSILLR